MFEPGTSNGSSNCILPKNKTSKNGHIETDKKRQSCPKKATKKDMIESLVSDAANRLGVEYVTEKKQKNVQNGTSKKRNSCSALLSEKPQTSKRQRTSCEAKICNTKIPTEAVSLIRKDLPEDGNVNEYLVMVNKQLKALQELPVIQRSSTSRIQDFISKLDESQVELFLKKKADGILPLVGNDQNAKSILSFIQKKLISPVYEQLSLKEEVVAPSNHGADTSLAGPSCNNCHKKVIEVENPKSDHQEVLLDICLPEPASTNAEGLKASDNSEVNPTSDDVSEVTSTSVVENENEVTSSSESMTTQSHVPETVNSSDVFKLDHLLELFNCNEEGRHSESGLLNVTELLNLKDTSIEETKSAFKKDFRKFFRWMISFADSLKMFTDILTEPDSNAEVIPTAEKNLSVVETPLNQTSDKELKSHCQCCVLKSKEDTYKVTNLNSTSKITEQPSNLSNPENKASTSASSEATSGKIKILSSTTLDNRSSSIEAITIKTDEIIDETSDNDTLIKAEDAESNGGVFNCKKCDYTTKNKYKLKRHIKYAKKNPLMYNHKKGSVKKSES